MNKIPFGWISDGKGGYSPPKKNSGLTYTSDVGRESELHSAILAECRKRGWIAFHGSMAHATARVAGEPDFILLADNGRVFFIECKTKTGKLSTEQLGIKQWAGNLGHEVHVIRSMEEFCRIVDKNPGESNLPTLADLRGILAEDYQKDPNFRG